MSDEPLVLLWAPTDCRQVLDSSSEFIFGEGFEYLLPSSPIDSAASINAFNIAQKGVGIWILLGKLKFVLARYSKFQHACKLIKEYTQIHIGQTLRQRTKRGKVREQKKIILISELAKETNDRSELCSQLLNMFFTDRQSCVVSYWICSLLTATPLLWRSPISSFSSPDTQIYGRSVEQRLRACTRRTWFSSDSKAYGTFSMSSMKVGNSITKYGLVAKISQHCVSYHR
jgi:hypothetical protein